MREFVIVTDSCCDLPQDLVQAYDVKVLPLSVQFGSENFKNAPGEGPSSHEFYQRLYKGEPAQTSAANAQEFKDLFQSILAEGKDILSLSFSSALSATYQNSCIAAEEVKEEYPDAKIITIDTLCASLGQGLIVDLAVQKKREGKTIEEVAAYVEEIRLNICHWFTVGNLTQLRRGGRLSAGKAVLGSLLHIKPVLHVDNEGRLVPMETVKGRKASIKALVDHMEATVIDSGSQRIYISHGDCLADAKALEEQVRARMPVKEVVIGDIGPVIGAHSGYETLALFFVGKER